MKMLTPQNAASLLRQWAWLRDDEAAEVSLLAGGVSNEVFRVSRGSGDDFVVKQARGRLKVAAEWTCSIERIWRERDVMLAIAALLRRREPIETAVASENAIPDEVVATVPLLLHENLADYAIAISAAPATHQTWKSQLLRGQVDQRVAAACGKLLAAIHAEAWMSPQLQEQFADRSYFDALRLDPYYRHLGRVHPQLTKHLRSLEASLIENCLTLVHGDFSPKNLLVDSPAREMWLLDFEVGHFGDPAFDLGFFLTHLSLKRAAAASQGNHEQASSLQFAILSFCEHYESRLAGRVDAETRRQLWARTSANWLTCCLARVDGKSPVEYLTEPLQEKLRTGLLQRLSRPSLNEVSSFIELAQQTLDQIE